MLPVVLHDFMQPAHNLVISYLDSEFAAAVKAAGGKIDGAHNRAQAIREQHFAVQLEMLHLADLDANVVHDAQTSNALDQLFLLERVGRTGHHVDLHSTHLSADQVLN